MHPAFQKGKLRKFPPHDQIRYKSKFTKVQRDEWFSQIWALKGTRQTVNELECRTAAYPDEIAERLIKMFSVKGDAVLDPFLGSGTTMKTANYAQRRCIGYEIEEQLLLIIQKNVDKNDELTTIHIIKR
ncbi:MAG: site-specific DNA-methyltransferase [Nitrososphaerota archaeon]|nr:site-specific DNA-methyltransferase [Nitrososphaerota archaeon]